MTSGESERGIERPGFAEGQELTVYNVASWKQLTGNRVRHDELGEGVVERSNVMSKEAWVRFDDSFKIIRFRDLELVTKELETPDTASTGIDHKEGER